MRKLLLGVVVSAAALGINACEESDPVGVEGVDAGSLGAIDSGGPPRADASSPSHEDGGPITDAGGDAKPDASTLECADGTGDCDLDPANGCEITFAEHPEHCGRCGRNCAAAGATCQVDKCSAITLYENAGISTDNSGARSFAFGNSAIYHAGFNSYAVRRFPTNGSGIVSVWAPVTSKTAGIESLVTTATDVFWAEKGTTPTMLSKAFTAASGDLPKVAFEPEYTPTYVNIVGGKMYWASGDYQSGDPAGYIYARDVGAAATDKGTRIVTENQGTHGSIAEMAVATDAIYWATRGTGQGDYEREIRTTPLSGGTPTIVPGGIITSYPYYDRVEFQTVGETLYFNRNVGTSALNGIYAFKKGDVSPTQVVSDAPIVSFRVVDDTIYYTTSNTYVHAAPRAGGQGKAISTGGGGGKLVGADASFVYSSQGTTIFKIVR